MRFSIALIITSFLVMAAPTLAVSGMFSYEITASPYANYLQPIAPRDGILDAFLLHRTSYVLYFNIVCGLLQCSIHLMLTVPDAILPRSQNDVRTLFRISLRFILIMSCIPRLQITKSDALLSRSLYVLCFNTPLPDADYVSHAARPQGVRVLFQRSLGLVLTESDAFTPYSSPYVVRLDAPFI
ncbi:hypothetical protein PILCRDRAFT_4955 [Piloderma croceum F 1598]|uniref:Uncharacterized protein n=1 Tax=Piloderma croceum (strain F 1598) TaxID=765440 RepID=A0A0C3BJF2_PILCF|nr:hypothetical protein PILCRDRAFT_4955 [Piloderma croceum F 1598]